MIFAAMGLFDNGGRTLEERYESVMGQKYCIRVLVLHMLILGDEGDLGEDKAVERAHEQVYWQGMQKNLAQWICTCAVSWYNCWLFYQVD